MIQAEQQPTLFQAQNSQSSGKNQPKGPWNGPYGQSQQQQKQQIQQPNFYVSSQGVGFKQLSKPEEEGQPFNINLLKEIADPSQTKGHMRQPNSPKRSGSFRKPNINQQLSSSLSADSASLVSGDLSNHFRKQDSDAKKLIHQEHKNYQNKTDNFNTPVQANYSKKGSGNLNLKKDKKCMQPKQGGF